MVLLVTAYLLMVHKLSLGYVDLYYPKFTQPAGSLVIGLSRAHTDIDPAGFDGLLAKEGFRGPMMNFAFDRFQSPFSELYLNGVKRKLNHAKNGLFIVAVSPGDFTAPRNMDADLFQKTEEKLVMGKLYNFSESPNYDYIINCFGEPLYSAFFPNRAFENQVSHSNGWNEIRKENRGNVISKELMYDWRKATLRAYERIIEQETVSEYRLNSFKKILDYLTVHGEVFLVRLPAHNEITELENKYWPSFDMDMEKIAEDFNIPYLDYSGFSETYTTYDGSHLLSESAKRITAKIVEDIESIKKQGL